MNFKKILAAAVLMSAFLVTHALVGAGTTGNIKGIITDKATGKPVVGASVLVVGTTRGAKTDWDGKYFISNLEPGTYQLRITHLHYEEVTIDNVEVKADETTKVSVALEEKPIQVDRIKVIAKPDPIKRTKTSSESTIPATPVTTVLDLVNQTPNTSSKHKKIYLTGNSPGNVSSYPQSAPIGDPQAGIPSRERGTYKQCSPYYPPSHGGTSIVNGEPFDAMFFKHYGVNPFVDTEDDHLSTFAIDVDDASYVMTRSYLERGYLPPEDAVRVEEFINHFSYRYPAPHEKAFNIFLEGAPSKFGKNCQLLKIGIKGKELSLEERKPANLVFIVDVSGSMQRENRIELVRKALLLLVNQLMPEDKVGIVVYGSYASVVLEMTSAKHKRTIEDAIYRLIASGATNAEEGIRLGYQMAWRHFDKNKINHVILCSDGVANVGRTNPDDLLKFIKGYADRGITLTTVGFGMGNYNDVLMEKLSDKGNGHYAYVDDLKEARRVFVENLTGTLQVIARDVKVQVDFNPEVVRSYRLLGYENRDMADNKFRDDKEDGGEIGLGHEVTVLYEIKLHKHPRRGKIGTVYVRFKDPETFDVTEISRSITPDIFHGSFDNASQDFRLAAAAAEFAEILRGSYWAKDADWGTLKNLVWNIRYETESDEVYELDRLISKASALKRQIAEE